MEYTCVHHTQITEVKVRQEITEVKMEDARVHYTQIRHFRICYKPSSKVEKCNAFFRIEKKIHS